MTTWTKRFRNSSLSDNVNRWNTAGRPAAPDTGATGFNTDYKSHEVWTGTGWQILMGTWTTLTRPSTAALAAGSQGNNTTIEQIEEWNGSEWLT